MTDYIGGVDEDDPRLEAMAAEFEAECLAEEAAMTDADRKARDQYFGVDAYEKLEIAFRSACEKDPSMAIMATHWHWAIALDNTSFSITSDPKSEDKTFYFDPDKVREKTLEQLEVILRHEWAHVVLNHHEWTEKFIEARDNSETQKVWRLLTNVATDLEINSMFSDLYEKSGLGEEALIPGKGDFAGCPMGLKAEDYANLIMASPELMAKMREFATWRR